MARRRRKRAAQAEQQIEESTDQEVQPETTEEQDGIFWVPFDEVYRDRDVFREVLGGIIDCLKRVPAAQALFSPESIMFMISRGELILWRCRYKGFSGYCTTSFRIFPLAKIMEIPFAWGDGLTPEVFNWFRDQFEELAKKEGCAYFKGYGRKGWQRAGEAPSGWLEVREFLTEIPQNVEGEEPDATAVH